jgi:hypothetical protein
VTGAPYYSAKEYKVRGICPPDLVCLPDILARKRDILSRKDLFETARRFVLCVPEWDDIDHGSPLLPAIKNVRDTGIKEHMTSTGVLLFGDKPAAGLVGIWCARFMQRRDG